MYLYIIYLFIYIHIPQNIKGRDFAFDIEYNFPTQII